MSLPVADAVTVRRQVVHLLRRNRRLLTQTVLWFTLATACGLVVPALLGNLVESVQRGTTSMRVDVTVMAIAGFLAVQAVLVRVARLTAARLGEGVLANIREEFVERVLSIPVGVVERAGTGDLLTRSSRDIEALSRAVRMGAPSILVAGLSVILTLIALAIVSPIMLLPCLLVAPALVLPVRWYLRRARAAYLAQASSYSDLTSGVSETVSGAKTVEALGRAEQRMRRTEADIARSNTAERRTLFLRSVWFPLMDFGYMLPVAMTLLVGGLFYTWGWVGIAEVTAAALYTRALVDPLDELLTWLDELQVGDASFARLIGINQVVLPRPAEGAAPDGNRVTATGVCYSYDDGRDVINGIDLDITPGERVAIVGPSGAGKSTLGRVLAGIYPLGRGSVTLGGVALSEMPLETLRGRVILVNQEHHVFMGTIRENIALADPTVGEAGVNAALEAVSAMDWVRSLPEGLDTKVGRGGVAVPPDRAQQLALARLVIADPRTLVLDEATSMIDPREARNLERSLAAVLEGRTVISIAHRLHTAHDADRVVLMENGRIEEQGSHDELLAAGGAYARLWESWHGRGGPA